MYDFTKLSEEEIIKLIREDILCFIPKEIQTERICLETVKKYGCYIEFIDNPTEQVKLESVKNDGEALRCILNPTYEMQLIAVKNKGLLLGIIEEQTIELCVEAIKQNPWAIQFVNNNLLEEVYNIFPNTKFFRCEKKNLLCEKVNAEWLFTIGCQDRITKEQFIDRIYNHLGGLEINPHRKEYLKILEQF